MRYSFPSTHPQRSKPLLLQSVTIFLACCVLLTTVRAQKMFHSIGPNVSASNIGVDYLPYVAVSYTPRFNFYEKGDYSVSIGMPLNIGAVPLSSPGSKEDLFYWEGYLVSVPAVVNFNWGTGATSASSQKVGFFAGTGLGYLFRSFDDGDYAAVNGIAATVNTGVRVHAGRKLTRRKKHVEFRLSYTQPLQKLSEHVLGFHVLFCRQ